MATPLREVAYRMALPVRGAWPGRHRSASGDGGLELRAHVPLDRAPDARRLDLLASLRDPFGRWLVRQTSQRLALPVVVVADLSASMAYGSDSAAKAQVLPGAAMATASAVAKPQVLPGAALTTPNAVAKPQVLADLTASLAWSAWKSGDSFGFFGCAERLLPEWTLAPTRVRGAGAALAERLRRATPSGSSAAALADVAPHLGRRRALVFLVSDFHLPLAEVDRVLHSLALHQVVPVVLAQPTEAELGPRAGLAPLHDAETGRQRWVWWRPALRQAWQAQWAAHQAGLQALFRRHQLQGTVLDGAFDADRLNRVFQA